MSTKFLPLALALIGLSAYAQNGSKPAPTSTEKVLIWKPTKQEFSFWNSVTSSFDLVDSTFYTFIPTESLPTYSYKKNSSGIIFNTNTYQFDANGNVTFETHLSYNSGTLTLDTTSKYITTFDSYGNNLSREYFSYTSGVGSLQNHKIFINQLNAQNKPIEVITQNYNLTTLSFENQKRLTYTYNSSGKTSVYTVENWNSTSWDKSEKYELTFDGTGFCTGYVFYENDGSNNWVIASRITNGVPDNPYEDFNNLEFKSYLKEGYDVATSSFFLDKRLTTTETTGNKVELYEDYVSGSWQLDSKTEYQIDNYGNITRRLETFLNSNNAVDTSAYIIYQFTYDSSNNPIMEIRTDSINNNKTRYVYSDYVQINIQVAQLEEEAVNNEFSLFPNPANHSFGIQGVEFTSVAIYNATGNLVSTTDQKTIDISALPAGMYYVRVVNNDEIIGVQKLIKE